MMGTTPTDFTADDLSTFLATLGPYLWPTNAATIRRKLADLERRALTDGQVRTLLRALVQRGTLVMMSTEEAGIRGWSVSGRSPVFVPMAMWATTAAWQAGRDRNARRAAAHDAAVREVAVRHSALVTELELAILAAEGIDPGREPESEAPPRPVRYTDDSLSDDTAAAAGA